MPTVIAAILDSGFCWVAARIIVTFVFWSAGFGQLATFSDSALQMAALGLHPSALFAVVVPLTLLTGSAMIVADRLLWLGTGILSVFLVMTIPLVHPFWDMAGAHQGDEMRLVMEHVSVIGGLMAIAIAGRQRVKLTRSIQ